MFDTAVPAGVVGVAPEHADKRNATALADATVVENRIVYSLLKLTLGENRSGNHDRSTTGAGDDVRRENRGFRAKISGLFNDKFCEVASPTFKTRFPGDISCDTIGVSKDHGVRKPFSRRNDRFN
jgi:hypothetical protein